MTKARNQLSHVLLGLALAVVGLAIWYGLTYQREAQAKEARLHVLRDMIDQTSYAFVVLNPEGQISEWGAGAERLFGWRSSDVLGCKPDFLMPEPYRQAHAFAMQKPGHELSPSLVDVSCWAYTRNGDLIPIRMMAASVKNHRGYYHIAMIVPQNDLKQVTAPKPEIPGKPVQPHRDV